MPPPRVYKTAGVVLRQRKLGEADKVLTIFTPNLGKLDAVAKGVRRPKSKLAGHVEPLTHTSFLIAQGRTLDIVTQAQAIDVFLPLREDLERTGRALYAAELVDRFTAERQESYPVFRLFLETLGRLAARKDLDTVLRYFEMRLLDYAGFRPQVDRCVSCGAALEPTTNYWSASGGGVICPGCVAREPLVRPLSVNALKVLRLMQGSGFAEVARVAIPQSLAAELERHLRDYLRYVLERDIRSADFIDSLRRSRRQATAPATEPS
jgi:DNA repair protein RecO (recombination protein O)